jgi:protein arginine kinase
MKLGDLTRHAGEWLRGTGAMHDVVISTRVRLARNLADMPFLTRCSASQQGEMEHRLREEILHAGIAPEMLYVDVAAAEDLDRRLLVERHLISRQHADAQQPRGVAISTDETVAIMVNEEDHLRIQVLRSGLELDKAFQEINRIDDVLETRLRYAFHSRYGYLTACPTNVGTGMRVSVMLHLPALKMTNEIEKAFRAARDMRLAIRGLYGEGTEATGDFFQLSNQTTLGRSEEDFVQEFRELIPRFIDYERQARQSLMRRRLVALEDKVARACALLRASRLISSEETLYLLSLLRLGVHLGLAPGIDVDTVNELFLATQIAHLQKILGRSLEGPQRAEARAEYIRRRLPGV